MIRSCAVLSVLLVVAGLCGLRLRSGVNAAGVMTVHVMPSNAGGGTQFGMHYDDLPLSARDFSHSNSAWLRGKLVTNPTPAVSVRYMYWDNGNCRVRGRLQKLVSGTWVDDYSFDVDILHLTDRPPMTSYTQTVTYAQDWFYKAVGTASTCNTGAAHSHLGMTASSYVYWVWGGSLDTCWANSTTLCLPMPASPRRHAPRAITGLDCKGAWLGQYATTGSPDYKRSGAVGPPNYDPYQCQDWSGVSWGQDSAVFVGTK